MGTKEPPPPSQSLTLEILPLSLSLALQRIRRRGIHTPYHPVIRFGGTGWVDTPNLHHSCTPIHESCSLHSEKHTDTRRFGAVFRRLGAVFQSLAFGEELRLGPCGRRLAARASDEQQAHRNPA